MKKSIAVVLAICTIAISLSACQTTDVPDTDTAENTDVTNTETIIDTQEKTEEKTVMQTEVKTEAATEYVHEYVNEPDQGEGYEHILLDRNFTLGFGCEWNLGKRYTLESGLKQGNVTHYQDIGMPFYVVPLGSATKGEASGGLLASSGLEDNVYWQFEEGHKKHFVDAAGKGPYELQSHRIAVNSVVKLNEKNRLLIEQYNDYLHLTYPDAYPDSDPLLVKTIDSNRNGKMVLSYNSYNDISNSAYAFSSQFAEDTWPHLLLHQSFAAPVDLARYSSIEFSMQVKVNRAEKINNWPHGSSDRYDQPLPPAGAAVSAPETSLQTYFFIRSKKSPYTIGAFVGIIISSSNESLNREHLGLEQNGIDFYRINLGNKTGKIFGLEGDWLEVGEKTTVRLDLIKYLQYVLKNKFENENPNSKWYGITVDDVYLSFFNLGYEYCGNWDCEFEVSNLYARGILKEDVPEEELPEEEGYAGKWHLSVDEFEYGTGGSGESGKIVGAATSNLAGSTIANSAGSCSKLSADYVHLKSGWIAVDGYEIQSFTCKIYAADGNLLKSVSCGFYEADDGVINHVMNNMGYAAGSATHRFNGNPNRIELGEFAGQTVTLIYEVEPVGAETEIEMIKLEVIVPENQ